MAIWTYYEVDYNFGGLIGMASAIPSTTKVNKKKPFHKLFIVGTGK